MSQAQDMGYRLLASGTYTKTSGTNMTIPVSYTGTPKFFFVCIEEHTQDAAQTAAVGAWLDTPCDDVSRFFTSGFGAYVAAVYAANNNLTYSSLTSASAPTISANNITVSRTSSTYQLLNTKYNWYIYGV